ncbi:FGGY family carbohydrate kinase [Kutzneria viridogrisea]|uniref:Carbohydrate kinase FGGY n=2 Tax=Kutzneria TaxID=43356 RepID=W5VXS1_9PSEU|nr:gluconokinase [Kutzneria albida]AHH93648.1 carbohydrate kinase FGGY [Kutzneria albida DSM 43870]MBA8928968.1 gluconokinase [Kutzneria viridogrisea]MBA8931348.1 gluconokinase [Kutzneria viridogrisea]
MSGVVLGVDLGTTATKVVATRSDGRVVAVAEQGYPLRTDERGTAVQDPHEVLAAARKALTECVARVEEPVRGLSFSSAMHTLLALDAEGEPLTPALSWADNRAVAVAKRLRADHGRELHAATGTPVHPSFPLAKLVWFAEHEPDLHRGAAKWAGLKDFVLSKVTGRLLTEHSNASGTGLMNSETLDWHEPSLRLTGLTADRLPELVAPTEVLSLTMPVDGLPSGLPVVAGGGDGPLANLGVGAVLPGMAALSLGTSGALRVIREHPGVDDRARVFCYALAEGLWVLGGAVSNGGVVAQWAAETFDVPVADLLAEAEQEPSGAGGLVALPYLLGERAPWWDPDPRAVLLGLRREHGRAAITRAMVEGVAQQLALVRDAVLDTGAAVDTVRVTGGAFKGPLWTKVVAAALGHELEFVEGSEGSGVGACLLGWRALGELPSLRAAAELITPDHTAAPDEFASRRMAKARPALERIHAAVRDLDL